MIQTGDTPSHVKRTHRAAGEAQLIWSLARHETSMVWLLYFFEFCIDLLQGKFNEHITKLSRGLLRMRIANLKQSQLEWTPR